MVFDSNTPSKITVETKYCRLWSWHRAKEACQHLSNIKGATARRVSLTEQNNPTASCVFLGHLKRMKVSSVHCLAMQYLYGTSSKAIWVANMSESSALKWLQSTFPLQATAASNLCTKQLVSKSVLWLLQGPAFDAQMMRATTIASIQVADSCASNHRQSFLRWRLQLLHHARHRCFGLLLGICFPNRVRAIWEESLAKPVWLEWFRDPELFGGQSHVESG